MRNKLVSDEIVRIYKDRVLSSLGISRVFDLFIKLSVKPNHLSWIGFVFGCASVFFMFNYWQIFLILYLLYIVFDNLDGSYARYSQEECDSNYDTDHVLDSIVWIMIIISASINQGEWWTLLAILIAIINTILVFIWKKMVDYRARGVYLLFYLFGYNALGLQVEIVYVLATIIVRLGNKYIKTDKWLLLLCF